MRIPKGLFPLIKEVARHLLRRPVVGIVAAARTEDGQWLLIRRGDTGEWALPGGTVEWGETLRAGIVRELLEEAGSRVLTLGDLIGAYSDPSRDPRFHAVTLVVAATVSAPEQAPLSEAEIAEVGTFPAESLPEPFAPGMRDMLENAISGTQKWE
jgi:8-oxo-dGTP diphosphatase